jgi:hypothetical protein
MSSEVETSLDIPTRNSQRFLHFGRNDSSLVQQKSFVHRGGRKTSQIIGFRRLRRGRRVDVDVRLRFRLSRWRRIYDCRVALLFLRLFCRRIGYGRLFLLARRQQSGAHQKADVFFHVRIGQIWVLII